MSSTTDIMKTTDPSKKSFSSMFFLLPANGNKVVDQWVARSWQGILSIIAASTSVGGALQGIVCRTPVQQLV